jgi:predicted transcriptional regulator
MESDERKISLRTQVLLEILEFQEEHNRGVMYTELLNRLDLNQAVISKSLDSLQDIGLIMDKWYTLNKSYNKVIYIPTEMLSFVIYVRSEIANV